MKVFLHKMLPKNGSVLMNDMKYFQKAFHRFSDVFLKWFGNVNFPLTKLHAFELFYNIDEIFHICSKIFVKHCLVYKINQA